MRYLTPKTTLEGYLFRAGNTKTNIPALCSIQVEIAVNFLTTHAAYLPAEKKDWSGRFFFPSVLVRSYLGALAARDRNDRYEDGIVGPTNLCAFDPVGILGSNQTLETSGECLDNMHEVNAARNTYLSPPNSFNKQLIKGRYLPGSELSWSTFTTSAGVTSAEVFTINAALPDDLPLNWTLDQYDWDTYPYRMRFMEDIHGADYTSLKTFRAQGRQDPGYQGYADASLALGFDLDLMQSSSRPWTRSAMRGRRIFAACL
jgi:hypothetical protein